jgi:hypothetical protein
MPNSASSPSGTTGIGAHPKISLSGALELDPDAYIEKGMYSEAISEARKAKEILTLANHSGSCATLDFPPCVCSSWAKLALPLRDANFDKI